MRPLMLFLALCAGAFGVAIASAERVGSEGQIASFDARLTPSRLPRHRLVPVKIRAEGEFQATAGNHLAQLESLEIALNRHGKLFTKGLPVCHFAQLVATSSSDALAACDQALVGHGEIKATNFLPEQEPTHFHGTILAFNGGGQDGGRRIFLHMHGKAFGPFTNIIPIKLRRTSGTFETVLFAAMPEFARKWAYLTKFKFEFGRRFSVHGHERSFLRANCPAPKGLNRVVFPFARATYRFQTTKTLRTTLVGGCRVRARG